MLERVGEGDISERMDERVVVGRIAYRREWMGEGVVSGGVERGTVYEARLCEHHGCLFFFLPTRDNDVLKCMGDIENEKGKKKTG